MTGTLLREGCAPVCSTVQEIFYYTHGGPGSVCAPFVGTDLNGKALTPPYAGHTAPADVTADGRYVLLTAAVGPLKSWGVAAPGIGYQNSIMLMDRQRELYTTLLSGLTEAKAVIWPRFNADASQISWSQMVDTKPSRFPLGGTWELCTAAVDLEAGKLSDRRSWQDLAGPAFYECYGWMPSGDRLIVMSTTRASVSGFGASQLWTVPFPLQAGAAPTRISPAFRTHLGTYIDAYHEWARFRRMDPNTLYTAIGANTVGGDDIFAYDLLTETPDGYLAQPRRVSFFGGEYAKAVPGWPAPSYKVIATMAEFGSLGWAVTVGADVLTTKFDAWSVA